VLYGGGKLFSEVDYIDLSDFCVCFKCFIAKNDYTSTKDKFV